MFQILLDRSASLAKSLPMGVNLRQALITEVFVLYQIVSNL